MNPIAHLIHIDINASPRQSCICRTMSVIRQPAWLCTTLYLVHVAVFLPDFLYLRRYEVDWIKSVMQNVLVKSMKLTQEAIQSIEHTKKNDKILQIVYLCYACPESGKRCLMCPLQEVTTNHSRFCIGLRQKIAKWGCCWSSEASFERLLNSDIWRKSKLKSSQINYLTQSRSHSQSQMILMKKVKVK